MLACNNDVKKAERGIVFIDEIDKIAKRRSENASQIRDVGGEGAQGLLKLLERTTVNLNIKSRVMGMSESVQIDTSNILFILSGAFNGIQSILRSMNSLIIFSRRIYPWIS